MLASWSSSYCNSVSGRRLEHVLTVCPQPSSLGSPVFELLFSSASSSAPVRLKTFTQRWGALLHSLSRALPCWAMYAMFMSVTRRGIATLHIIIKRAGRFATVFRSDVFLIHSHSIDPSVVPQLLEPTGHLNVVVVAGQRTATSPLHALATRLQLVHSSRPALHRSFHHLQPREMESWTQGAYVVRVPNRAQVSAAITKHLHIVCLRLTSSSCQRPSTFDLNDADSQLLALMGEVEARTSSAFVHRSIPISRLLTLTAHSTVVVMVPPNRAGRSSVVKHLHIVGCTVQHPSSFHIVSQLLTLTARSNVVVMATTSLGRRKAFPQRYGEYHAAHWTAIEHLLHAAAREIRVREFSASHSHRAVYDNLKRCVISQLLTLTAQNGRLEILRIHTKKSRGAHRGDGPRAQVGF
ncbi:hypothetical protein EXIGLDRAFT_780707 [Exidia glandulosa HHB12029]|uniref:Uncharacterized protein n=1 Tax=Exidia glandulosa HHB12029 TaxID=1314781 RepID=A0A165BH48_EXIGL|nr:hypothetical protein EXIGLDRAFT_780707 [Exidia glandulosa HHB12029]